MVRAYFLLVNIVYCVHGWRLVYAAVLYIVYCVHGWRLVYAAVLYIVYCVHRWRWVYAAVLYIQGTQILWMADFQILFSRMVPLNGSCESRTLISQIDHVHEIHGIYIPWKTPYTEYCVHRWRWVYAAVLYIVYYLRGWICAAALYIAYVLFSVLCRNNLLKSRSIAGSGRFSATILMRYICYCHNHTFFLPINI